jgi:polysaccharide export outer membrane protein
MISKVVNIKLTMFLKNLYPLCAIFILYAFSSCYNTKNAVYFNNLQDGIVKTEMQQLEPIIQKKDVLSINVSSANVEATRVFNVPNATEQRTSSRGDNGLILPMGYLVGQDGFIEFPVLGKIKAAGLTKKELKEYITKSLLEGKQLVDPIVDVRYMNYRVTVLGEVGRPSVISVPSERITLLEALGLAGDLTIFAQRNNVLVIRETEGAKVVKRINLNTSELFNSPYYFLNANDVVYVEPNAARVSANSQSRIWLPIVLSAVSVAILIIDRLTR